jgi:hypothetical protein
MGAQKKLSGDELIANFMNLKCENSYIKLWMPSSELNLLNSLIYDEMEDETWYVTSLRFKESWDWLMPCISKILEICCELDELEKYNIIIDNIPQINNTYKAIIEFIEWYNGRK